MSLRINITGDFVVSDNFRVDKLFSTSVIEHFLEADLNIINLEAPITPDIPSNKIIKTGPHLRGSSDYVGPLLTQLNINLVTLANNHILDYGTRGVSDTLAFCKNYKFETVGADMTLEKSQRPFRKEVKGKKISIINFAENEWSSASEKCAGANPMDLIDNIRQIQEEKNVSDIVIVIAHGGHEYYNLPSPRMVKQYRFYAENGADLVVGHHTHCISGYEVYKETPIFYSLGNFLFTKNSLYEDWYIGLILEIQFDQFNKFSTVIHPVKQEKRTFELSLLKGKERTEVLERIQLYNNIIGNELKVKQHWDEYVRSKFCEYLYYWSPVSFIKNRYIKGVFRRLGISKFLINKRGLALYLNLLRCEAHSDMTKDVLIKFLKK